MRVAIVNDSVMAVEALRRVVSPGHDLAWIARDGQEAVERAMSDRPELILMDLMMPRLDGVEATRRIMERCPCPILIVTASVQGTANLVFEALGAGALDAVKTPLLGLQGMGAGREGLLAKIDTIKRLVEPVGKRAPEPAVPAGPTTGLPIVAMGASSGGPMALVKVLQKLPSHFPAAIVIVQHIDPEFSGSLAQWLGQLCPLPLKLAVAGERPQAGHVYVAGAGGHLVLTAGGRLALNPEPQGIYLPSVDELFRSVARHGRGAGVLLSGMGADGAAGMLALRQAGQPTIVQDEATSAIFGMPRAAIRLGAAQHVLPLDEIAGALVKHVR